MALGLIGASPANSNSQQQQDHTGAQTQAKADPTPAIHEPEPAEEADPGCAKAQDDRQSDLCAQWKAADAAYDSAVWTARTYQLAIAGTVIGGLTLIAAGMAAKYARDAARETKRTADIAQKDQRPWVSVAIKPDSAFRFTRINATTLVEIRMTNLGKTVAREVIGWAEMYLGTTVAERDAVVARLREGAAVKLANPDFHKRTILPGQCATISPDVSCPYVEDDIYRVIAFVEYSVDGSKERHSTWEMFDAMRTNKRRIRVAEGDIVEADWCLTPTGISDAD